MKRVLKFRAIDQFSDEFIYGQAFFIDKDNNQGYISNGIDRHHCVKKETICQFTGLKDTKGNEIYENDIVTLEIKGYGMKPVHIPFLIVFNVDGFQGCNLLKKKKDFVNGTFLKQPRRFNYKEWNKLRVIGNIYHNPELINN